MRLARIETVAVTLWLVGLAAAGDRSDSSYVKVEIKGVLKTGLVAIGGETTGFAIKAKDASLELDFGKDRKLRELAEKMSGKTVVAAGTLSVRQGVEVKQRLILRVVSLKSVEETDN